MIVCWALLMRYSVRLGGYRYAVAAVFLLVAGTLPCLGQGGAIAPSCDAVKNSFQYTKAMTATSLLAVVGDKLEEASTIALSPDKEHSFFYVYHNNGCKGQACVSSPIIAIKMLKVTTARAPSDVFLLRDGELSKTPIQKNLYDTFHTSSNIKPRGPYKAFNNFHETYKSPSGETLYSHLPKARREAYLFDDIPANSSPWLTAMNFQFERNPDSLPQCIRFSMNLNSATSAYIEVAEIEDGLGGISENKKRWAIKFK